MTQQTQETQQAFLDWSARLETFLVGEDTLTAYRQEAHELQKTTGSDSLLVVAVGEVNAGKSSLLNILSGENTLPVDSAPCTDRIWELPAKNGVAFVDTPGTNSPTAQSDTLTKKFLPSADLILVVLPAKNPFGQTVWSLLEELRSRENKQLLFVLQQCDLLKPADLTSSLTYLREYAVKNGFTSPEFYPVSAKKWNDGLEEESGIPALQVELERLRSSLDGEYATLRLRMETAATLLQKLRMEVTPQGVSIVDVEAYTRQVQKVMENNASSNSTVLVQFEADFKTVLSDLDRQVGELTHAEARYEDLKRESRVREFLGIAKQRYDTRAGEMAGEFAAQLKDNFQRTAEQISRVFLNAEHQTIRVSRRTIFEEIDTRLGQVDTLVRASAQNVTTCGNHTFNTIGETCSQKSRSLCAKARRKFQFTALLPIILLLLFTVVVPAIVQIVGAASSAPSSDADGKTMTDVAEYFVQMTVSSGGDSKFGLDGLLILVPGVILAGGIYITAVSKSTRKWLIVQLQTNAVESHDALRQQLPALQEAFDLGLRKTLEEADVLLMGVVSDFLSKNAGMGESVVAQKQLDILAVFESDLQHLRMR